MTKVKMYTTATCVYCRAEKAFLKEKGIEFSEVDVDTDQVAAEEMMALTGQMGVPVTIVRHDDGTEEQIIGFDRPRLEQALGL